MSTIIDGRGNVSIQEPRTLIDILENKTKTTEIKTTQIKTMTTDEYRKMELTPEQEWNNMYNPKRVSIEALDNIEIRKKGKGPEKLIYDPDNKEPGPYYDPFCSHVHIWKPRHLIKNFTGKQFQNVKYIQFTENTPGVYCCVCHCRNNKFTFKSNYNLDYVQETPTILKNDHMYKQEDILKPGEFKTFPIITKTHDQPSVNINLRRWETLMYKVKFSMYNEKTIYPVSRYRSLYTWPWELTAYQKFKLKTPDYKNSNIFVNETKLFKDDYAIIV